VVGADILVRMSHHMNCNWCHKNTARSGYQCLNNMKFKVQLRTGH